MLDSSNYSNNKLVANTAYVIYTHVDNIIYLVTY